MTSSNPSPNTPLYPPQSQGKMPNNPTQSSQEQGGFPVGSVSSNLFSGEQVEETGESEVVEGESESERSDIDEGGEKMVPLPPYVQRGDPNLTLAGGPPEEPSVRPPVSIIDHSQNPSSTAYASRAEQVIDFSGSSSDQVPVEVFRDPHDFSSEDIYERRTNLERRNSEFRFILVGRAASDAPRIPFLDQEMVSDTYEDDEEEDTESFVNYALLSHLAVLLRDKVPKSTHTKGSIPYPNAFTGKDIVVCAV